MEREPMLLLAQTAASAGKNRVPVEEQSVANLQGNDLRMALTSSFVVMPAKAGIQKNLCAPWIPAFAGMTACSEIP